MGVMQTYVARDGGLWGALWRAGGAPSARPRLSSLHCRPMRRAPHAGAALRAALPSLPLTLSHAPPCATVQCETPQLSADVRGLVDSNVTGSAIKLLRGATDHDLQEDASRQWRDLKFDLPPPPRRSRQTRRPPRPPARLKEPAPKPKPDCSDEPHPDPDQDPCHGAFVGEKNLAEAQRRMEALEEDSRRAMVRRRERELDEARTVAMRLRGEPVQDEYPPKRFHKRPSWFPPPGWERIRKRRIPGMRTFQTGEEGLQW